jgi:gentisate 1,2-dioxygenase
VGVYVGADGDRPTRTMDALVHEFDPGTTTTIHRHAWDAMVFVVAGWGWTEIDGERIEWGPGDSLHIPAWAWHRSGNDGTLTSRYLTFSSEPMLATMGMSTLEDAGHTPFAELGPRPAFTAHLDGDDPYARRVRRLGREQTTRRAGRLHTSWDELELINTSAWDPDQRSCSTRHRIPGVRHHDGDVRDRPGRGQSMHRHPGEAWLYVVEGEGHTYLGTEPEGGAAHPWKKGDLIVVDHFLWHQHFNDHPEKTAKVVRIHMFDSLLETMRALCDPLVLFEEPPTHIRDRQAGDPASIQWPALERPTWP